MSWFRVVLTAPVAGGMQRVSVDVEAADHPDAKAIAAAKAPGYKVLRSTRIMPNQVRRQP